jgi:glycosyltransferase involved in cell wall biosynthesis
MQLGNAMKEAGVKTEMKVIPNVVNTDLFKPAAKSSTGKKKILHVSTLNEQQKNISGMMRVIKKLSESRNDFELEIISEYDYSEAARYAESIGLKKELIRFKGLQPLEEVARSMQQAAVFVLFSNEENLPCVLLESVSCGTPVISTNVGGISEWINEETGILINKGDENALLLALHQVLDHPQKFNPLLMHEYIHKHFSYPAISKQFDELYTS